MKVFLMLLNRFPKLRICPINVLYVLVQLMLQLQLQSISGAPRGAFQQPVDNLWLKVLARPLSAVHSNFCLNQRSPYSSQEV